MTPIQRRYNCCITSGMLYYNIQNNPQPNQGKHFALCSNAALLTRRNANRFTPLLPSRQAEQQENELKIAAAFRTDTGATVVAHLHDFTCVHGMKLRGVARRRAGEACRQVAPGQGVVKQVLQWRFKDDMLQQNVPLRTHRV